MLFGEFLYGIMKVGAFLHFGIVIFAPFIPRFDGGEGRIDIFEMESFVPHFMKSGLGAAADLKKGVFVGSKRGFSYPQKGGF